MRKRLAVLSIGILIMYLYYFGHKHAVTVPFFTGHIMSIGQLYRDRMISYPAVSSLTEFNKWVGTNYSASQSASWDFWLSSLVLEKIPNRYLGIFLFQVPYLLKMAILASITLTFTMKKYKKKPKSKKVKKRKKNRKKKSALALQKKRSGDFGEFLTMELLNSLPDEYCPHYNLYIKASHTSTRPYQFDHILVSRYGIFHIDSKYWHGGIHITDTEVFVNGASRPDQYKNPDTQARLHQKALTEYLSEFVDIEKNAVIPIICFTHPECVITSDVSHSIHMCKLSELEDVILSYNTVLLSHQTVNKINWTLERLIVQQTSKNKAQ